MEETPVTHLFVTQEELAMLQSCVLVILDLLETIVNPFNVLERITRIHLFVTQEEPARLQILAYVPILQIMADQNVKHQCVLESLPPIKMYAVEMVFAPLQIHVPAKLDTLELNVKIINVLELEKEIQVCAMGEEHAAHQTRVYAMVTTIMEQDVKIGNVLVSLQALEQFVQEMEIVVHRTTVHVLLDSLALNVTSKPTTTSCIFYS
jgi:hypothetical protein